MRTVIVTLTLLVLASAIGCTQTDHPLFVSQPAAELSDEQAQQAIIALGRGDRAALIAMGVPAAQVDDAIAAAGHVPDLPDSRFALDGRVGSRYFRQYVVQTTSTPAEIEVRVWLAQRADGRIQPTGLIVLPRTNRGESVDAARQVGS
ncbi:MAG: hypothetical protein GC159_19195 [Phycisphaera sp.]|nr:hypothetical protein [Phycisphaera sp.]